jgi:hypothetical protein
MNNNLSESTRKKLDKQKADVLAKDTPNPNKHVLLSCKCGKEFRFQSNLDRHEKNNCKE